MVPATSDVNIVPMENRTVKYGFFDDEKREYVINTPRTPLPWINYLGTNGFFR